jgi:hypothetical protein
VDGAAVVLAGALAGVLAGALDDPESLDEELLPDELVSTFVAEPGFGR